MCVTLIEGFLSIRVTNQSLTSIQLLETRKISSSINFNYLFETAKVRRFRGYFLAKIQLCLVVIDVLVILFPNVTQN